MITLDSIILKKCASRMYVENSGTCVNSLSINILDDQLHGLLQC